MFFRLLRAIDDDVTSVRIAQQSNRHRLTSIRVKDAMRDDCIHDVFITVTRFIQEPHVARQALDIITRYIEWVDLSLVLVNEILRPIYDAITASTPCDWRAAAAASLRAIVLKRMDFRSKALLFQKLELDKLLSTIRADVIIANDDGSVDSELNLQRGQVEVAALINTIVLTSLDIIKHVSKTNTKSKTANETCIEPQLFLYVAATVRNSLPVALQFLNESSEDDTGAQTLACVTSFVNVYGQSGHSENPMDGLQISHNEGLSVVGALLNVIEERSCYVPDAEIFDSNSERGRAFNELRKLLLGKVFSNIGRLFTPFCVDFVKKLHGNSLTIGDAAKIEVALSMVVALNVVAGDSKEVSMISAVVAGAPPRCMEQVGASEQTKEMSHIFELVSNRYFDIIGRCSRVLADNNNGALLETVLNVIFDRRGLSHVHSETVRVSAANALVRIAKPLRGVLSTSHVEAVVQAAHRYILPIEEDISSQPSKRQMMMLETSGYLLGMERKHSRTVDIVRVMLKPLLDTMEARQGMGRVACIAAIGAFSKGFGGDCNPKNSDVEEPCELWRNESEIQGASSFSESRPNGKLRVSESEGVGISQEMRAVWISCMDTVVNASWCSLKEGDVPWMVEMRLKLLRFLHRMVETVGSEVISYLGQVIPLILTWGQSSTEMKEILSVMSQSVIKFGVECVEVAKPVYKAIVHRMSRMTFSINESTLMAVSETDREAIDVLRGFLYWVSAVVSSRLIDVFLCNSGEEFGIVMNWLVEYGVGRRMDVRVCGPVMRTCWQTLGEVVAQCNETRSIQGLDEFVVRVLSSASLSCGNNGVFLGGNHSSAQAMNVATEVVKTIRICLKRYGSLFSDEMYKSAAHVVPRSDWDALVHNVVSNEDISACVQHWVWLVTRLTTS